jgi:hypothetical protein
MAFQATENNGNKVSFKCCCSLIAIVFTIIWFLGSAGYLDGQAGGPPTGEYNMATSFNDAGSIDGITRGICDGNYKYSVSSSGILQSDNYPASYDPNLSCTNQFDSVADGITFEFQSFSTESSFDFIVFRETDGTDFGGPPCSGSLTGLRISVDSSRLPVSIHFTSDTINQESGFSIAVSAGYDSSNDLNSALSCGQEFHDYDYYYNSK